MNKNLRILVFVMCICMFILSGCGEKTPADNDTNKPKTETQVNDTQGGRNIVTSGETVKNDVQNEEVKEEDKPSGIVSKEDKANILAGNITDALNVATDKGVVELKFKNTNSDEYVSSLNGKKVKMTGYISTLSPVNGKFAYLMNMPYQSCPYCVPGTSQIYNTIAIYAKENSKIEFTNDPVTVEGTLETGTFTDEFSYEYGVRIANATVKKADVSKLSQNILMYSAISEEGIVDEIYATINGIDQIVYYDYYEYYYQVSPDTLSPFDTGRITTVIGKLKGISTENYKDIISVLESARTIALSANKNLTDKNYEKNKELQPELDNVFRGFSTWMAKYEM